MKTSEYTHALWGRYLLHKIIKNFGMRNLINTYTYHQFDDTQIETIIISYNKHIVNRNKMKRCAVFLTI